MRRSAVGTALISTEGLRLQVGHRRAGSLALLVGTALISTEGLRHGDRSASADRDGVGTALISTEGLRHAET